MGSMSCKIAIVYHSAGGNTKALAEALAALLPEAFLYRMNEFDSRTLPDYDALIVGTGETNYNHFCGAVDHFRDMLFAKSQLLVTLKIEQMYQESDLHRLQKFASLFQN
jgi:flavodoxin I